VAGQVGLIVALNARIGELEAVVAENFGRHPAAETYRSQPGLGDVLCARVLAEFGDDPHRYHDARARKNYAGTSPITRASGKKTVVLARYARNRRLADAIPIGPSAPCGPHQVLALTTTPFAPVAPDTTPPYANSATASSASSTAA
jgi:transposase